MDEMDSQSKTNNKVNNFTYQESLDQRLGRGIEDDLAQPRFDYSQNDVNIFDFEKNNNQLNHFKTVDEAIALAMKDRNQIKGSGWQENEEHSDLQNVNKIINVGGTNPSVMSGVTNY